MSAIRTVVLLLAALAVAAAWPRRGRSEDVGKGSFIGETTNELATAILQSYIDDDSNLAFSPLGYSVILAILAEGARGETRKQLTTALKTPEDEKLVRNMYQSIMKRLHNSNEYKINAPEFKNWFYVYKNYTINEDYKKILEEYYLTEVKSVEKYDSSFFQVSKDDDKSDKKDPEVKDEPLSSVELKESKVKDLIDAKDNSKDVLNFEEIQKDGVKKDKPIDKENAQIIKKDVEEAAVEVKSATAKDEKIISFAMEDKPEKSESELYDKHELHKPGKNIKEKIKLANTFPKKNQELGADYEIMEAVEARNHARTTKHLFGNDDITSSLSANRVVSKDFKDPTSVMILFNGLYFRGSWRTPFKNVAAETFYKSPTEKKSTPMMMAKGTFKSGSLPGLDSVAVELPYYGDRYALLVVVPRARDGLKRLAAELSVLPGSQLPGLLQASPLEVRIPAFYVEVTTKPLAALAKFGVSSIFSPEADLSGISSVEGLFVQEMVQHVSVKVDNGGSAQLQLSASNPSISLERSEPIKEESDAEEEEALEQFVVNRPFIFFVRDVIDNVVVVAGKVTDPVQPDSLE